jgi:hypothetical protein
MQASDSNNLMYIPLDRLMQRQTTIQLPSSSDMSASGSSGNPSQEGPRRRGAVREGAVR